jgi:NAD(P)-dependent dehydrogenase (short-subunit alcohol dehydrogenase family)
MTAPSDVTARLDTLVDRTSLKRWGEPREIAQSILFLAVSGQWAFTDDSPTTRASSLAQCSRRTRVHYVEKQLVVWAR